MNGEWSAIYGARKKYLAVPYSRNPIMNYQLP